jgi:hypothetical protein
MYATKEEFRALAHEAETGTAADTLYDSLLERASRLVDLACEVEPGFFDKAANSVSNKVIYGEGNDYLRLPPFVADSIASVELPAGYDALTANDYYVDSSPYGQAYLVKQYGSTRLPLTDYGAWNGVIPTWPIGSLNLITNNFRSLPNGYGWPRGVAVTISAKWGWADTPADIKQATIETAIKLWRESDPANLKTTGLDAQVVREALPPMVQMVCDRYREKKLPAVA